MMLLACFLPLLAVAAAWPNTLNGYPTWQKRPTFGQRTDIARLFSHLGDENVALAIAKEFESLGIDLATPFHEIQPELALRAVQKVVASTVPTMVPEQCSETVALKAFLGFGRHYWHELFERTMLNAVEECNEVVRIALLADSTVTGPSTTGRLSSGISPLDFQAVSGIQNEFGGIGSSWPSYESQRSQHIRHLAKEMANKLSSGLTGDVLSRIGIRMPGSGINSVNDDDFVIPTLEDIEEIKNAVMSELDRKLEKVSPVADIMVMDKFFKAINKLISVEGAKGKSVGEVLSTLSMLVQTELSPIVSGNTCQSTGTIRANQAGIEEVIAYMKGDYLAMVESVTRSPFAKKIVVEKMRLPMSKFADALMVIENVYTPDNLPEFFVALLGEAKQHVVILSSVSELVREFVDDQILYPIVSSLAEPGQTKPLLKMLLRTFAMQMAKLNVEPQEIRIILRNTIRALTPTGPMGSRYYKLY